MPRSPEVMRFRFLWAASQKPSNCKPANFTWQTGRRSRNVWVESQTLPLNCWLIKLKQAAKIHLSNWELHASFELRYAACVRVCAHLSGWDSFVQCFNVQWTFILYLSPNVNIWNTRTHKKSANLGCFKARCNNITARTKNAIVNYSSVKWVASRQQESAWLQKTCSRRTWQWQ